VSELERVALDLAERGYHVFPLRPHSKRPITGDGFKSATTDERRLLHWWSGTPDANIGIACGASGIDVLDIDTKAGADPQEVIADLDLEHHPVVWTGEAPERSAKHPDSLAGGRGAQIYFRGERKTAPNTTIRGVELRGAGAYVVAPPSVHPSGVPYLGELPPVDELPELPAAVIAILAPQGAPGRPTPATEWLSMLRDGIDQRHNQLPRIAGHLLRRYVDVDLASELLHLINEHRCRPPLPSTEVDRIFEGICRLEMQRRSQ